MSIRPLPLVLAAALVSGLLHSSGPVPAGSPQAGASACEGCARRARVGRADPGRTGVALRESILSRLAETLTAPCFRLQRTDIGVPETEAARFASKAEPAEYVFEARYEENLNQQGTDGSVVMSRLTVDLFYDGEPRERVASWSATSGINSYTACVNRMFANTDAVMRSVRPIEALLEEFERRPVTCRVHPSEEELACGDTIDLMIVELKDGRSRQAKPFNRILIEAEKGRILGGSEVAERPRARAFLVEDALLQLQYRAPEQAGGGEDVVTVFSSCDVASPDRLPLSRTTPFRRIAESRLKIRCGVAPGTVVYRREVSWDSGASNAAGSRSDKGHLTERAVIRVELKYTNTSQGKDRYTSARASADYAFSYQNDVFINGRKADVICERVEGSGQLGTDGSADVMLVVDRWTGEYELSVGLRTPERQERGSWSIGVTTLPGLLRGKAVDGRIRGSYAAPAEGPATRAYERANQGNARGTTFEWNLELPGRK